MSSQVSTIDKVAVRYPHQNRPVSGKREFKPSLCDVFPLGHPVMIKKGLLHDTMQPRAARLEVLSCGTLKHRASACVYKWTSMLSQQDYTDVNFVLLFGGSSVKLMIQTRRKA